MQQGTRAVMPRPYEIELQSYALPAVGPGQLLIQNEASAISAGTELAVYTGVHQWLDDPTRSSPRFPFVPGYSGVGRVVAVGEDVVGYAVGDRVIYEAHHETHGLITLAGGRTLIARIGEEVPAETAAFVTLARFPLTALVQSGQIVGQSVAIFGLGLIGQLALRLYTAAGAYPIIGIDPVARRRKLVASIPGVATLDPTAGDLRAALREINGGQLPDIVVDATGAPNTVNAAMDVVADGGKVIMVGSPRGIAGDVDFYWNLHGRSIQLIGAHGSAIGIEAREKFPFVRDRAMRLLVHFLQSGKLRIDDIVTHYMHGSELKTMYEGLLNQRDEFIGVAVHW
ncbi:MAG: zinc-binding dehydrogenase [Herpetosiphonaceae bacterium]|nr:zinc-binding dehydrogenase [Herpetosiphonaceae bacterium]